MSASFPPGTIAAPWRLSNRLAARARLAEERRRRNFDGNRCSDRAGRQRRTHSLWDTEPLAARNSGLSRDDHWHRARPVDDAAVLGDHSENRMPGGHLHRPSVIRFSPDPLVSTGDRWA